jgi:hypothetical protein
MPRLRGTPRRGAAWYAAKSRRKRKEAFEKAMAIAARRRRSRGKAIVEEAPPDERQENPPEYTWFSVPGHWNSRLNVLEPTAPQGQQRGPGTLTTRHLTLLAMWRRRLLLSTTTNPTLQLSLLHPTRTTSASSLKCATSSRTRSFASSDWSNELTCSSQRIPGPRRRSSVQLAPECTSSLLDGGTLKLPKLSWVPRSPDDYAPALFLVWFQ